MTKQRSARRVALITGANKGIGLEIARQLGGQGITVLLGVRDEGRGEEAAEKLRTDGVDARSVQLDVTRPETIDRAARRIAEEFGRLDILVNNAGIFLGEASPSELDVQVLHRTFETNFFGPVLIS